MSEFGRFARRATNDFIYPVDERDEARWGAGLDVLGYFGRLSDGAVDTWRCDDRVEAGDRIWVYANTPHARIVAVGVVQDDPQWADGWWVRVGWDVPVTHTLLKGEPPSVTAPRGPHTIDSDDLDALLAWLDDEEAPDLARLNDRLLDSYQAVRQRQGHAELRRRLMVAYGGRCAVTGCDVQDLLEATYIDGRDREVTNGLLLRADIRTLFVKGLLWIDDQYRVRVTGVEQEPYRSLDEQALSLPTHERDWPDTAKLRAHRDAVGRA